jgi:hypothetical protein
MFMVIIQSAMRPTHEINNFTQIHTTTTNPSLGVLRYILNVLLLSNNAAII